MARSAKRARVCVRLTCVVAAAASQLQWTRQSSIVLLTEQVYIVLNWREVPACCCFCCCAALCCFSTVVFAEACADFAEVAVVRR